MSRVGRNHACPCGSGRKYKQCCGVKAQRMSLAMRITLVVVGGAIIAGIALGVSAFRSEPTPGAGRVWSPEHGHYH
jgi:SEC-C motif